MPFKIFYLDDEIDILSLFADTFSSPEIEITTFSKAQDLFHTVASKIPDLVLIDYRLPGITGDQVALKLDPSIPKILITGDIKVRTEYRFEAIVYKPFKLLDMQELLMKYHPQKKSA